MKLRGESLALTFFLLLGLLLYLFPSENPFTDRLRRLSYLFFSPFLKVERELEEEVEKFLYVMEEVKRGSRIVSLYRKQLEREKVLRERIKHYERIMEGLERDLDFQFPQGVPFVISKIILYDPSGTDKFFVIRDGKNKGIEEGDLVVARGFVLGVVEEVYLSTSKVKTLFNERCSLLAYLEDLYKTYVYRGNYPYGELLYVDLDDPVREGSRVLYKDLTMRIPPFPIGEVVSVSLSSSPYFKEVKVKPYLSPREAEFVVVFKGG